MALFAAWRLRFGCTARFFLRLRLGVALAFGRFLRDFAIHTRGREALQRSIFAVGASSAAMRRV